MTALAPILQAFITGRLMPQYGASPHTIASYRDTFKLALSYIHRQTSKLPAQLELSDLDAVTIGGLLQQLETVRGNSTTTRNTKLAAIHSLIRYANLRCPDHALLNSRVLAIQNKRTTNTIVTFLDRSELDALLSAPDQSTGTAAATMPCSSWPRKGSVRSLALSPIRWWRSLSSVCPYWTINC